MNQIGLRNPLGIAGLISKLMGELATCGYQVAVSGDMAKLDLVKQQVRGYRVGPMHDPEVCDFSQERAFWIGLVDSDGDTVGLQAFRCDHVETSLADWLPNYMIGVYMRRQELMVPSHSKPPQGSMAEQLKGRLVYCGELWIDKSVKGRNVFDIFTRIGLFITLLKWNPRAIWGLAGEQMARHGHVGRIGYMTMERGFLRWQWKSKDVDSIEYLAVAEKSSLENIVDEMVTSGEYAQRAAVNTQQTATVAG